MIPNDSCQAKDFFRDRGHAGIGITVRWPPKSWHVPTGRVMDEFHGPSKLGNDVLVRERCHMRVGPSMHSNVILIDVECGKKLS
jgi:hypothetical protein